MVDATGEPDALQIDFHGLEVVGVAGDRRITINNLQHLSDAEIVFAKLIKRDISPPQGGFRQIENQRFLLRGQLFEAI